MIKKELYGILSEGEVYCCKLDNDKELSAEILRCGGIKGFDKKVWNIEEKDGLEPSTILTAESADGEEGFPGNCIDQDRVCKNGDKYAVHQALCLETQFFPNSL